MDADLEAEVSEAQRLVLRHAPRASRVPWRALLALDARLGRIVRRRGEPTLAQMRLAWWRDTLERPVDTWPRGDPLLDAFAGWREPARLAALADGWEHLLAERLGTAEIEGFAQGRAAGFATLAREVGAADAAVAPAARNWALADLAANLSDPVERAEVLALAHPAAAARLAPELRPLAILAALGARALRRGGRPLLEGRGAALVAMRVGLFGR